MYTIHVYVITMAALQETIWPSRLPLTHGSRLKSVTSYNCDDCVKYLFLFSNKTLLRGWVNLTTMHQPVTWLLPTIAVCSKVSITLPPPPIVYQNRYSATLRPHAQWYTVELRDEKPRRRVVVEFSPRNPQANLPVAVCRIQPGADCHEGSVLLK